MPCAPAPFFFPKAGMLTPASWTWQHSSAEIKIWPSRHCFTPNERTLLQPLFRVTLCLGSFILKMGIKHKDRILCVGFGCLDIGYRLLMLFGSAHMCSIRCIRSLWTQVFLRWQLEVSRYPTDLQRTLHSNVYIEIYFIQPTQLFSSSPVL